MSNLISGKEALIALANGEDVLYLDTRDSFKSLGWADALGLATNLFFSDVYKFKLKPKTILINGVEVTAPFKPNTDCIVWIIDDNKTINYRAYQYEKDVDKNNVFIGMWRTEDEIKQVVEVLRKVFNQGEVV